MRRRKHEKEVVEGVVNKGENFEVFSIPLVEVCKKTPMAKLSVRLKGYKWSDPVEVAMPTMEEEVGFKI